MLQESCISVYEEIHLISFKIEQFQVKRRLYFSGVFFTLIQGKIFYNCF